MEVQDFDYWEEQTAKESDFNSIEKLWYHSCPLIEAIHHQRKEERAKQGIWCRNQAIWQQVQLTLWPQTEADQDKHAQRREGGHF